MIINCDFHTHTTYSHGKGTILENAVAAKNAGLTEIAVTDHGFSHPAFGMRRRKLDKMRADCVAAEKATGVKVLLGIESNLLGISGAIDVKEKDYDKLDIILAGIHRFVLYDTPRGWWEMLFMNTWTQKVTKKPSDALIKYNTAAYCNAIKNNPIDIITHVGFLNFCDAKTVAECCADHGTYFEINTKKVHLSVEDWQKVLETKVNFVISSDAHSPSRVGDAALFYEQDKLVNFPRERIHNIDGRRPTFRFEQFKNGR
ncbi:MAG: PHP domain-containing protein [Clostridia bacterium]|nr:PHP domain-containing protein [Clostridia bacterium]